MLKGFVTKVALSLALVLVSFSFAQQFADGRAVMEAVDARPAPKTTLAEMTMTMTKGGTLTRQMQQWAMDDGTVQNNLLKFTGPADVEGSGFLTLDDGSSDESFLWLPALGRVRRLAAGNDADAFFGSDFSNEDISNFDIDDYTYTLLEYKDGIYTVEGIPVAESQYEKVVTYVDEATLMPRKVEYYKGGAIFKTLTIAKTEQIGDYLLPTEQTMTTPSSNSSTTIALSNVQLDQEVPAEVFTERFLTQ